ncbi:MAG: hypothetical protein LBQ58_09355 [Synergistaceae bacterium]|jgi:hypothetical protein|nr:hypothetical protein [Synergistaceae bacterium]
MKLSSVADSLHCVLESLATKPPRRKGRHSYSYIVKMGFDDICKLRLRGYSFQSIMEGLIDAGFFEEDADVKHLCQAFARERKKRINAAEQNEETVCDSCSRK